MIALTSMFVLHFIADFVLQSREMGKKKSVEFPWLFKHIKIQFLIMFVGLLLVLFTHGLTTTSPQIPALFIFAYVLLKAAVFSFWNALIHGVIDWNIWKIYKYSVMKWMQSNLDHPATTHYVATGEWKYYDDHMFYVTIGFDQLLHALTIVFLYWGIFL